MGKPRTRKVFNAASCTTPLTLQPGSTAAPSPARKTLYSFDVIQFHHNSRVRNCAAERQNETPAPSQSSKAEKNRVSKNILVPSPAIALQRCQKGTSLVRIAHYSGGTSRPISTSDFLSSRLLQPIWILELFAPRTCSTLPLLSGNQQSWTKAPLVSSKQIRGAPPR